MNTIKFGLNDFHEDATERTSGGMIWSPQQEAVFDWVRNGSGSAVVIAVAGSGKTTTLIEAVKHMGGYVDFAAYNKSIALEIKDKLSSASLKCKHMTGTFHSFGFQMCTRILGKFKVEGPTGAGYYKMDRVSNELNVPDGMRTFVRKLVSLAKQRAIGFLTREDDIDSWYDIVNHFGLEEFASDDEFGDLDELIYDGVEMSRKALSLSNKISDEVIDYDDMIYLPLVKNANPFRVDWLLVDEAQDTNPARRALARKMLKPGGRSIWVGDPAQAIYGFTGADSDSIDAIKEEFGAVELPLTVSYRCPKKVVSFVQQWVSHIEAHKDAPDGEVTTMSEVDFGKLTPSSTDAILCRNNAPLIGIAYSLIRRGIPCTVEGRDIGQGVLKLVSKWKIARLDKLMDKLLDYRDREVGKLLAKGKEMQAATVDDKVNTALALINGMPTGSTVSDLIRRVDSMFSDSNGKPTDMVRLSSIHKSKGREWGTVYLYGRNAYQPSKFAIKEWQVRQEYNLMYVGGTRAKSKLVEVVVSVKKGKK